MFKKYNKLKNYKFILIPLLIIISFNVHSREESPYDTFKTDKNLFNDVKITWIYVPAKILAKTCNEYVKKFHIEPIYNNRTEACSITDIGANHDCIIITDIKPTIWALGHEIRHCYQGPYHK